jgi:hypothetical protein
MRKAFGCWSPLRVHVNPQSRPASSPSQKYKEIIRKIVFFAATAEKFFKKEKEIFARESPPPCHLVNKRS